ncbi:hypothetical protein V7S43_014754 [Phytophthora oleae]|uniref:Uncharacterized protein n=1 Tax=Phytophthora oleae TaxID=2107226 RepID=A0ABD3F0A2_9STRA
MHAAGHEVGESSKEQSSNLVHVTSTDDDGMLRGAPLELEDAGGRSLSSLHQEADGVLEKWLSHSLPSGQVAVQLAADEKMSAEVLTRLLLVRRNGTVCWSLQGLFKYVNILRWFREVGAKQFPSIAALTRIWLGHVSSGGLITSSRRLVRKRTR